MIKRVKSKFGQFDFTEYPMIVFKPDSSYPSIDDVKDCLNKYSAIIKNTEGKFVLVIDSSEMNWINKEPRQYLAVGFQNLEKEFKDRYMLTILYSHRPILRVLLKITTIFIPPVAKQVIYSKLKNALNRGRKEASKFKT